MSFASPNVDVQSLIEQLHVSLIEDKIRVIFLTKLPNQTWKCSIHYTVVEELIKKHQTGNCDIS